MKFQLLAFVTLQLSLSTSLAGAKLRATEKKTGYCNHNPFGCDGLSTGTDFCQKKRRCLGECAGNWCIAESEGYCSPPKGGCNGEFWSGWCGENKHQCDSCGGLWCLNAMNPTPFPSVAPSGPTLSPTDMPTISLSPSAVPTKSSMPSDEPSTKPSTQPTVTTMPSDEPSDDPTQTPTLAPTAEIDGYCNYEGCNGVPTGGGYCNSSRRKCTKRCNGTWCPKKSDGYCTWKKTGCDGKAWTGYCAGGSNKCGHCGGLWCYNAII